MGEREGEGGRKGKNREKGRERGKDRRREKKAERERERPLCGFEPELKLNAMPIPQLIKGTMSIR